MPPGRLSLGSIPIIRGITAPASLKPGEKIQCRAANKSYPGHNCPGLIEAMALVRGVKPGDVSYPGHNCPGLIEAIDFIADLGTGKRYPGHNCPGLIEAAMSVS
ncbi:protein of unknown function [Candidatus Methylocalor cossyra]|uniref:Uncharacterized protein n=1 Tax=Candidatus Methylocalor cossyra TaxID=3108543 RepID=A0ABP1C5E3_9GAMM